MRISERHLKYVARAAVLIMLSQILVPKNMDSSWLLYIGFMIAAINFVVWLYLKKTGKLIVEVDKEPSTFTMKRSSVILTAIVLLSCSVAIWLLLPVETAARVLVFNMILLVGAVIVYFYLEPHRQ